MISEFKTILHMRRLYFNLADCSVGISTCHVVIYMHQSVKSGMISFNCLSIAKYWVIIQGSDSLDN